MNSITWLAHYTDGSILAQSEGFTYAEVDRDRLQAFDLWQNGRLIIRVDLRDDSVGKKRLIYRLRTQQKNNGEEIKFYLVGWQRLVKGVAITAINYVFEDGSVLLGGQFGNDGLTDSIVPFPWESDLVGAGYGNFR